MEYEWEPVGRRRRGQQPMCWGQDIHHIMMNLDITTENALDRNRWSAIISER